MAGRSTTQRTRPRPSSAFRSGRAALAFGVVCLSVLAFTPTASAKTYTLPQAGVDVRVQRDGSVSITEQITFDYDGSFEGAWRDIPSRFGERVDESSVRVAEEGVDYRPGGSTTLGAPGPSNSYA